MHPDDVFNSPYKNRMAHKEIERVGNIISKTTVPPTIVNEVSNFVVVTYWWGRGNYNNNTARPCVAFYEELVENAIKITINTALTIYDKKKSSSVYTAKFIENIASIVYNLKPYKSFLKKHSIAYLQSLFEYCGINVSLLKNSDKAISNSYISLMKCIERKKAEGLCPDTFDIKSLDELQTFFHRIIKELIYQARIQIAELVKINIDVDMLKKQYIDLSHIANASTLSNGKEITEMKKIKDEIDKLNIKKVLLKKQINDELKRKRVSSDILDLDLLDWLYHEELEKGEKITNTVLYKENANRLNPENIKRRVKYFKEFPSRVSIIDILNDQLRFLSPLKFEDMIDKWENTCSNFGCNYLAVEYPEFAEPGGYQLAINAKPLFIKKALELCGTRAVVYIDGDMFIKKYPMIFDINDVDFMARGWWIDPRSSYKHEESILYDPYTFETSGGIMYFSQSKQAQHLVNKWIEVASKPYQSGKADDRVLSLIFNSQKMLLNMKIIQLPIEYLWLSLDYDERMKETVYNYNEKKMKNTIFVEHPECLTTEETASGAGASSDRTPKFYNFLGDYLVPVSETMHEYLMFPNKEMTNAFKDYFTYMDGITYIDDGNEDLYKKGFVQPDDPGSNESPLYIIGYDNKLGNSKSLENNSVTLNEVSSINFKRAMNMNIEDIPILYNNGTSSDTKSIVEIRPNNSKYVISNAEMISLILKLLLDGKTVVYNPINELGYDIRYYNKLIKNINTLYKDIEFGIVPIITSDYLSDFFKPGINLEQPILFRPGNRIMILFLSMFLSLDSFSDALHYGSYEFVSRVRIAYFKKEKDTIKLGGGLPVSQYKINEMMNNHENTLAELRSIRPSSYKGGKTHKRPLHSTKRAINRKIKTKRNTKNRRIR